MRKKVLLIGLALVLALAVVGSAAVLAKPEKSAGATPFTGEGFVYVTEMPDPIYQGSTLRFTDERVEGYVACDWPDLALASFDSYHDSIVKVDKAGRANGTMHGTFTLITGAGILEGTFHARISGDLFTWQIIDEGVWKGTSGTGVFEGVKAWGSLSAELEWNDDLGTLAGPLTWDGKYISAKE